MNYVVKNELMNCKDFVQILWIFCHNPYRCGPLRVGMSALQCVLELFLLSQILSPDGSTPMQNFTTNNCRFA